MALTKEQVWAAADDLESQQVKPTLVAVRKALSNKGSYSDISDHMRERRRKHEEAQIALTEALPHAVEQRLSMLGQQVWAAALRNANERLEAERQQFEHAKAHLDLEREQALQVANHVTLELEESQRRVEVLERSNDELRRSNEQVLAKLADSSERLAATAAQAAESVQRVADLNREIDRLHQTNADLVARLAASPTLEATGGASRQSSSVRKNGANRS